MAWFLTHGYPLGSYGGMPDHGLPGGPPVYPGHGLPGWGPPVDPGYGRPGWSPVDPGYGQGGGFRPDQGLPGYGHPGNRPPGSGMPPLPGHGLPPDWGLRPDAGLPGSQPGIDNTLPGGPNYGTGQPIIPGATPYGSAVATAPPDKVDAENGAWVLVNVQGALVWAWAQKPKKPEEAPPGTTPKPK